MSPIMYTVNDSLSPRRSMRRRNNSDERHNAGYRVYVEVDDPRVTRYSRRREQYHHGIPIRNSPRDSLRNLEGYAHGNDQGDMYSRIKTRRHGKVKDEPSDCESERTEVNESVTDGEMVGEDAADEDTEVDDSKLEPRRSTRIRKPAQRYEEDQFNHEDQDNQAEDGRYKLRKRTSMRSSRRQNERPSRRQNESESESQGSESEMEVPRRKYNLREKRPTCFVYTAPRSRPPPSSRQSRQLSSPFSSKDYTRKKQALHMSDSSSSTDDEHFEKRKERSMIKARTRCLPMNLKRYDLLKGILKDRQAVGSSLADVDPMSLDTSITFDSIGGLDTHVQSLKEMVLFPLLYPEVFEKFKISPPRGVLFYGPPGTGKTLVARALSNECSQGERKVAFFMRKGADCLSKWIGESERQLRLLFDQAYSMRPSIIFFDEIDGIAPVRSSRQDQIHSSIVSTLLALMDGLDSRGEVIVIGATNRLDAIDPALRRPGRFDREFHFPLPNLESRRKILQIHTKEWNPSLESSLLDQLALKTVGYCGADLKALCAEAALLALRKRYPQIYASKKKLLLDTNQISIKEEDFMNAINKIVPAASRSNASPARPLAQVVKPLLANQIDQVIQMIIEVFPPASHAHKLSCKNSLDSQLIPSGSNPAASLANGLNPKNCDNWKGIYRPRFLIHGDNRQGQSTHVGPAVLHLLEQIPHLKLDLPALYSVSTRTPEEAIASLFSEAMKQVPVIIYLPHVNLWWSTISETLKATFLTQLNDLQPELPVFILAVSDCVFEELPEDFILFFQSSGRSHQDNMFQMRNPDKNERRDFFFNLLMIDAFKPPPEDVNETITQAEVLPEAPMVEHRKLSEKELKKLKKKEERALRQLRLFLRDTLTKVYRNAKFQIFQKLVDPDEVPDYYEVIKKPMCFDTIMAKIDTHLYECAAQFLDDINLITENALEYNPNRDSTSRLIRHRACELKDFVYALIEAEMDSDFETMCQEIHNKRKDRGEPPAEGVPCNYATAPPTASAQNSEVADAASIVTAPNNGEDDKNCVISENNPPEQTNGHVNGNQASETSEEENSNSTMSSTRKRSYRGRGRRFKKPRTSFINKSSHNDSTINGILKEEDSKGEDELNHMFSTPVKSRIPERSTSEEPTPKKPLTRAHSESEFFSDPGASRDSSVEYGRVAETSNTTPKMVSPIPPCNSTFDSSRSQVVTLDRQKMEKLLDRLVELTEDHLIEDLESIYSSLQRTILKQSKEWNRKNLVKELKAEIERLCKD